MAESKGDSLERKGILSLSRTTLWNLSLLLNPETPLLFDWRALADIIGYSALIIENIRSNNAREDKTLCLLKLWNDSKNGASLKKLIFALKKMDSEACVDVVRKDDSVTDEAFERALLAYEMTSRRENWEASVFERIKDDEIYLWDDTERTGKNSSTEWRRQGAMEVERLAMTTKPAMATRPADHHYCPVVPENDTVFVSYYADDRSHRDKVLQLSKWLSGEGYTVLLRDHYAEEIDRIGQLRWTELYLSKAKHVLLIGSKGYQQNCSRMAEYHMLSTELVCQNGLVNKRVIVVLMDVAEQSRYAVPQMFMAFIPVVWPKQQTDLLHKIEHKPKYQKPKLGKKKILTSIVEKF